jgi:HPr kinase/phosphorylase
LTIIRRACKKIDSEFTKDSSKGLIGHLNFIHPNLIQVLGVSEIQHLDGMDSAACAATLRQIATRDLACFIVAGSSRVPDVLVQAARATATPLLTSPMGARSPNAPRCTASCSMCWAWVC